MENSPNKVQQIHSQQLQFSQQSVSISMTTTVISTTSQSQPKQQPIASKVKQSKNNTFSNATIIPITRNVKINDYCTAVYSTLHKIPLAVHQFLDKSIVEGQANREGMDFYQEVHVEDVDRKFFVDPTYYEKTLAYKNLKYDKGHMAPAKNYCGDQNLMNSTYTYANCIPQNSYFNRGSWKNLQSYCRKFVRQDLCDTIEIISGPIFYSGTPHTVDEKPLPNAFLNKQVVMCENGIVVPPKCYKIIKANVADISYMSAFVLQNAYKKDNDQLLKSHVVELDQLEMMTGLRFNLGKCKSLEELDPVGMSKTMGDLHLEFYTKLFKFAKTIADMNGARKQGFTYFVKVDIKCVPTQQKLKMVQKDYENTMNEVGWTRVKAKSRRKINALLALHRDAHELQALNQELSNKIIQGIKDNMSEAKKQEDKQYHKYIASKLYGKNWGYHYPLEEELKTIFENVAEKQEKDKKQNENQESQTQPLPKQEEQENTNKTQKKEKKKKYTPKADKQEHDKQQKQDQQNADKQGDSTKKTKKRAKKQPKPNKQQKPEPETEHIDDEQTIKISSMKAQQSTNQ